MNAEKLIQSIHTRAPLWDQSSKLYHNRDVTNKLWEELAQELESTKEASKKKWKSLRDVFRTELKKLPKPKSGDGAPCSFNSTWTFFESMMFLKNYMTPRKLTGSVAKPNREAEVDAVSLDDTSPNETEVEDVFTPPTLEDVGMEERTIINVQPEEPFKRPTKRAQKRKPSECDIDAFLQLEKQKIDLLKANEGKYENDEDYHFLMSFLPSMKNMSYSTKMLFRLKMQETLYKCTVPEACHQETSYRQYAPNPIFSPTSSTSELNMWDTLNDL